MLLRVWERCLVGPAVEQWEDFAAERQWAASAAVPWEALGSEGPLAERSVVTWAPAPHCEAMQPLVVAWEPADRFSLDTAVLVWSADWAREATWLRETVQVQARRHLLRDTVDPAAPTWEPPGSAGPADRQSGGGWAALRSPRGMGEPWAATG